jgi:hypothetical protein
MKRPGLIGPTVAVVMGLATTSRAGGAGGGAAGAGYRRNHRPRIQWNELEWQRDELE